MTYFTPQTLLFGLMTFFSSLNTDGYFKIQCYILQHQYAMKSDEKEVYVTGIY